MEFNILFAIATSLNFTIKFLILPDARQDFLFFAGQNSSAHLYRENNSVFLHLQNDTNYETYQTNIKNKLEFSWQDFKINDTKMTRIKSSHNESLQLKFDVYTFLSPIIENIPQEEPIISTILNSEKINYYYILAIILCVVLIFDTKPRIFKLLQGLITKKEAIYETMTSPQHETTV